MRSLRAREASQVQFLNSEGYLALEAEIQDRIDAAGRALTHGFARPEQEIRLLLGEVQAYKKVLGFAGRKLSATRNEIQELVTG